MSSDFGKILILGARGMLGRELSLIFNDLNPVLWDKDDLDITNRGEVHKRIGELKPDVIINAAAYTAVDDCETNRELANKVNGEAVKYLLEALFEAKPRTHCIFIHYSTDYVFDGESPKGYKEGDELRDPVNAYGASKLLGEQHILDVIARSEATKQSRFQSRVVATAPPARLLRPAVGGTRNDKICYYIIRTSWLYGKSGKNFVNTMLKLAETHDQLKVVNDQYGKPTYAYDLAKRTRELLEGNYESGIYHITNETEDVEKGITWYDFAREIFNIRSETVRISTRKDAKIIACSSKEYPRPARRPKYSVLVNTKLPPSRDWRGALREYLLGT